MKFKSFPQLLEEKAFESLRLYAGKPSVTTALKVLWDSEALELLKKHDLGKFQRMLNEKAKRWTALHHAIELTYSTWRFNSTIDKVASAWLKFYTREWHKWQAKQIEYFLLWDDVWWTADWTGHVDTLLTLTDWKTCWVKLYPELIEKYKMQVSKYADLYEQETSTQIEQAKIVMLSEAWWYKIITVTRDELTDYLSNYNKALAKFNEYYEQYKKLTSGASSV